MELTIILLMIIALVHFIYDQIVLPTARQNIRSNIFELRDELRSHLIDHQHEFSKETLHVYKIMDDRINHAVNRLHLFTFTNLVRTANLSDDSLSKIEEFRDLLNKCDSATPKNIHDRMILELRSAFAVNSLLISMWILPIVIIALAVGWIKSRLQITVKNLGDVLTSNRNGWNQSLFN